VDVQERIFTPAKPSTPVRFWAPPPKFGQVRSYFLDQCRELASIYRAWIARQFHYLCPRCPFGRSNQYVELVSYPAVALLGGVLVDEGCTWTGVTDPDHEFTSCDARLSGHRGAVVPEVVDVSAFDPDGSARSGLCAAAVARSCG